jgi:integrase/recombinase XerD
MVHVTFYKRKGKRGESLWLDYRLNGNRQQERTGLVLLYGKDTKTKQLNKDTLIRLDHLILEKQIQLRDGIITPSSVKRQRTDFFAFFEEYMELNPSRERRNISTLKKLRTFWGQPKLPVTEVTEKFLKLFKIYLEERLTGETPYDYFKALKKVIKQATKEGLFQRSPAEDVTVRRLSGEAKNALAIEELQILYDTPCSNEMVGRAFIFSCYTGLRYGDIIKLCWRNITDGHILKIIQSKTQYPVHTPLNEIAKAMVGQRKDDETLIFPLPTSAGTNKCLASWVTRAGIAKKITYHSARHTFGTLLHSNGIDILTTSHALGHRTLSETSRYVRVADKTINTAVLQIPTIK